MILNCCIPLTEQDKQFVEIVEKLFQFPTLKHFVPLIIWYCYFFKFFTRNPFIFIPAWGPRMMSFLVSECPNPLKKPLCSLEIFNTVLSCIQKTLKKKKSFFFNPLKKPLCSLETIFMAWNRIFNTVLSCIQKLVSYFDPCY